VGLYSCAPESSNVAGSSKGHGEPGETREALLAAEGAAARSGDWSAYAADIGSSKYTSLSQIRADNIEALEVVWRRPAVDPYYTSLNPEQRFSSNYVAAPVVIDGIAYITNALGISGSLRRRKRRNCVGARAAGRC
jgi:glucose dehydrogenase